MFVGHTHEDIDRAFSVIADELRQRDVSTLPELLGMLENPEEIRGGLFDIRTWLEPYLNTPKKHTQPHHYKFARSSTGNLITFYKGSCTAPWKKLRNNILIQKPRGQPHILQPDFNKKMNIQSMKKQLHKAWAPLFADQSDCGWWEAYFQQLERLCKSEVASRTYAQAGSHWILPDLPKFTEQPEPVTQEQLQLRADLAELTRTETNEPEVQLLLIIICFVSNFVLDY